MRLYLINPYNSLAGMTKLKENYWNRYRVWKPLGLLVVAGLTPPEWHITVIDENLGAPDYDKMPRPDLVGITAFTAQAVRAYEIAAEFRGQGVPVVLGGIHATMRSEEALRYVDAVVAGEAENIWPQVLEDVRQRSLQRMYTGTLGKMETVPTARHDLLPNKYQFGSVQTTRGCPLNCSFCSVTAFNGRRYRHRPIEDVIRELKLIREKYVLIVDDNIIGTRKDHIRRTKELFQAIIQADIRKKWIGQATVNMADDEELLSLAVKSGCFGVFIGFESPNPEGLVEVHKQFNVQKDRDLRASVKKIQRHGLLVLGSFIIGLDVDKKGIGLQIAAAAKQYGLDAINVLCLTPLPGTELWEKMETEGRIVANTFPEDWKYYTFGFPVARYRNLSSADIVEEMEACRVSFYSYPRILGRVFSNLRTWRKPFSSLVTNLSQGRNSSRADREAYLEMNKVRNRAQTE
jgi:radical SAM superfamily enzyme YgiQ (UPF0313 family)